MEKKDSPPRTSPAMSTGRAPMRSTRKPVGACVKPVTTLKVVSASPRSRKLTLSRSLSSGNSTGRTMM